jgi:predicted site-specific integrase-resolvase
MTRKLTPSEAAEYLRRSTKTLQRWRADGTGPPFIRKNGLVIYDQAALDRWLEEGTVNSIAESRYRERGNV